ncbi:membrane protein [Nocardiopsis prasina]|uniref:membrane protein n=1 Tax=Nocardiopsis prasina TaxID=2015 RepID=UPI000348C51F|nr:membrane protein [Nocardiopsis prasina]
MRHFVGFLSGLILGPVLLLVTGWAFAHLRGLNAVQSDVLQGTGPVAVAGLVGVGLLVSLVAVPPRLTPMLPFAAALVVGGATAAALLRMHLLERLPVLPGVEGALTLLPLGVFVPLALVLAAPVFVGARWVREDEDGPSREEYFDGLYEDGDDDRPRSTSTRAEPPVPEHHQPRHRLEDA